jgi:opacity protein-like surface antigen
MKYILSVVTSLFLLCSFSIAQDFHLYLTGGLINYQGDLQAKRFTLSQSHPFAGAGLYYEATDKLYLRLGFLLGKVSGDDKYSKLNQDRNLNFQSQLMEVQLGAEYDIINSYEHTIVPYIFAGVAAFHFNPYTLDSAGSKVYLQPLGTEGQGFYLGRKKYSLTQLSIPFGGGVKLALSDNINLRIEAGLRKLFTDYLDDVSTTFADEDELRAHNGQLAVDYAFRGDDLNHSRAYPGEGIARGNPKSKDFYYTGGITLSFRLQGNPDRNKPGKGKTGCPVNIY